MRNAKFWINKTSNQNIEGFTIYLIILSREWPVVLFITNTVDATNVIPLGQTITKNIKQMITIRK
jgi:hypothetical protein